MKGGNNGIMGSYQSKVFNRFKFLDKLLVVNIIGVYSLFGVYHLF